MDISMLPDTDSFPDISIKSLLTSFEFEEVKRKANGADLYKSFAVEL